MQGGEHVERSRQSVARCSVNACPGLASPAPASHAHWPAAAEGASLKPRPMVPACITCITCVLTLCRLPCPSPAGSGGLMSPSMCGRLGLASLPPFARLVGPPLPALRPESLGLGWQAAGVQHAGCAPAACPTCWVCTRCMSNMLGVHPLHQSAEIKCWDEAAAPAGATGRASGHHACMASGHHTYVG